MSDPAELWDGAWDVLARGRADRAHPARLPTLATIGPEGPEIRTLVLRDLDRDAAWVELHTDRRSAKIAQLGADRRVALHVWAAAEALQVRLSGSAHLIHADPERWADVPAGARLAYGGLPAPGTPIPDPSAHRPDPEIARFTQIRITVHGADILHLGDDRHRRALSHRDGSRWLHRWVAP